MAIVCCTAASNAVAAASHVAGFSRERVLIGKGGMGSTGQTKTIGFVLGVSGADRETLFVDPRVEPLREGSDFVHGK